MADPKLRPPVSNEHVNQGVSDLHDKIIDRMFEKGSGSYASRHEILGSLTEEYCEAVEAIRLDHDGREEYTKELLDVAVAAMFGYICLSKGYIK